MKKTISVILVCCLMLCAFTEEAFAFGFKEHNEWTEYAIFGDKHYSQRYPDEKNNPVMSLHCATYLCVDQFNYNAHPDEDDERLAILQRRNIPGLPKSVENDLNYTAFGEKHRTYTHRGWNYSYSDTELKKSHWELRKKLLIATVKKEFDPGIVNDFLSFLGNDNAESLTKNFDKKCEYFAELLYYCHILGDHLYDNKELKDKSGGNLDRPYYVKDLIIYIGGTRDNATIIHDLKECVQSLFGKKKAQSLISELDRIEKNIDYVRYEEGKDGGLNTVGRYIEYSSYAQSVLDALHDNLPGLLNDEPFFTRVFTN